MKIYREIAKIRQVKRDLASLASCDINANLFGVYRQYEGQIDIAYNGVCRDIDEFKSYCHIRHINNWNIYFEGYVCNVCYCAKISLREYVEKYAEMSYSRTRNYLRDAEIADEIGLFLANELLRKGISRNQVRMGQWRCYADTLSTIKQFYQEVMCNYLALSAKVKTQTNPAQNEWYVYGHHQANCKWIKIGKPKPKYSTIPISDTEFVQIRKLHEDNFSIREISATMSIPKSTVHRMLKAKAAQ